MIITVSSPRSDMIALNQDPLGHRASIAWQSDPVARTVTIFVKRLADPKSPRAAAIFNRGEDAVAVNLTRSQLNFTESTCECVTLTDLDTKKEIAVGSRNEMVSDLAGMSLLVRLLTCRGCRWVAVVDTHSTTTTARSSDHACQVLLNARLSHARLQFC